jgi:putative acetyltransferase
VVVSIAVESPLQEEVRTLIAELNTLSLSLSPPEYCFHMTVEEMAEPHTTVFVARDDGVAVGCGALRRHAADLGEVKRLYVRPEARKGGVGARILGAIEALARREGASLLVLETGHRHDAAGRLYERAGFRRRGPVLDYPDSPCSVFYEKPLAESRIDSE